MNPQSPQQQLKTLPFTQQPIFISGASRAGTSILTTSIGKHPDILGRFELGWSDYFMQFMESINYSEQRKWSGISISHPELYQRLGQLMSECTLEHYAESGLLGQKHFKYWSGKVPMSLNYYQHLLKLYPQAKFILIVRNGVSVLNSVLNWGREDYNFEMGCQEWQIAAETAAALEQEDNVLLVRQEQLVQNPSAFWQPIWPFLALPPSPEAEASSQQVTNSSYQQDNQQQAQQVFAQRGVAAKGWEPAQLRTFQQYCEKGMQLLGYELPS